MRRSSLLAILPFVLIQGAIAQEVEDTGPMFRQVLEAPILFTQGSGNPDGPPDLGGNSEPLAVTAGTLPSFATTGDPIAASISVTGGVPPYGYELIGTYPNLTTVDENGLGGTFSAGDHAFTVKVTDSDSPPNDFTLVPGWSVEVADPLGVGSMPSTIAVNRNSPALFNLPGTTGGTAPFVYSVDPPDARTTIENDKLRVSTTAVETLSGVRIKVVDHHGRTQFSNAFTINSTDPLTPANESDESQVQSVTGGTPIKGTSNRIVATAYSGKSGGFETRPSLRIGVGSEAGVPQVLPMDQQAQRVGVRSHVAPLG